MLYRFQFRYGDLFLLALDNKHQDSKYFTDEIVRDRNDRSNFSFDLLKQLDLFISLFSGAQSHRNFAHFQTLALPWFSSNISANWIVFRSCNRIVLHMLTWALFGNQQLVNRING